MTPSNPDILAVIVSFNPAERLCESIRRLKGQVGTILVVDNGSSRESLDRLRALRLEHEFELHELGLNKGVGYALNLGLRKAQERGVEWLLTMDQDSLPDSKMVSRMLAYARLHPLAMSLSPILTDSAGKEQTALVGSVKYAITSGNLVHMSVFSKTGKYNDSYFIDCIDFEFSLRVRNFGFEIHKVEGARMGHEVGETRRIPPSLQRFYTQHTPIRRYYSFRNLILLARDHFRSDPGFILKLVVGQLALFVLILVFDRERVHNVRLILRGLYDGIRDRAGPYLEAGQAGG